MGSPSSEVGRDDDETQHQVTLSAFRMSKHEITVAQFKAINHDPGYATHAGVGVLGAILAAT